jgi:hypothetical protein
MGDDRIVSSPVSEDHLRYAAWLARGTTLGFGAMAIAFAAYIGGVIDPHVSPSDLPLLWGGPAAGYLAKTGIDGGWGWLTLLHRADMLNLVGVAVLSGCSVVALLVVTVLYMRQRDRLLAAVCVMEILLIVLAASNLLSGLHS